MSDFLTPKLMNGNIFVANTHAELLNEVFGTNYKAWLKSAWRYSKTAFVWLVRIDGRSRRNFSNVWLNQNTILQRYTDPDGVWNGNPLNLDAPNDHRIVFEIVDSGNKKYIFRGVFLLDRENSTPRDMVFRRVSDSFSIK